LAKICLFTIAYGWRMDAVALTFFHSVFLRCCASSNQISDSRVQILATKILNRPQFRSSSLATGERHGVC